MARIKNTSRSEFKKMSFDEKKKELKRMAKRANVRMSLLEKKGIVNDSYKYAMKYNKSRKNNRFYEGIKYDNHKEMDKQFKALNKFLEDKSSTLTGIRAKTTDIIKNIIKKGKFDIRILKMSKQEKQYISQYVSKRANTRLKNLETKAETDDGYKGYTKYAYQKAEYYNTKVNDRAKNRYYTGSIFDNEDELDRHIQEATNFLLSATSTVRGVNNIVDKKINTFKDKGVKIEKGQEKDFFDFLSSRQFEKLKQYADSNQIIETFTEAREIGQEVDDINTAFMEFMNGLLDFTEVQERLQVAKWQNRLFH